MTALPLEPHTEAEEATVEKVARALWLEQDPRLIVSPWDEISEMTRERYRGKARAAIAEMPASPAEEALARVEALADELDAWRENALRHARSCPPTSTDAAKSYARAAAYQRAIARIRAAIAAPVAQSGEGR